MKKGLLLVLFLALIPAVSAQFYYSPYILWPVGVLGNFNFANIYDNYAIYIDAIIFLLIFIGLGKTVFGLKEGREREEPGYKLLYIGLALLMTISLLLLESKMRFTLLDLFGPWVSFILLLILTYAGYAITSEFIKNKWIVFGLTLASFLFFLDSFYKYFNGLSFLGEFIRSLFSSGNHRLLYFLALLLIVIGAIRALKLKASKPSEGGAEAPASEPEEGPRPAPSAAGPEEPIIVEREQPRVKDLLVDVRATLQEKDRAIAQLQEQADALTGAIEDVNKKMDSAVEAGRADLAEKMAERETAYKNQLAKLRERRKSVFKRYAEMLNRKSKELEAAGATEAKAAVEKEIKSFYAESLAEVGEPAKYVYEEGAEEDIAGIMRPKPPLLLPAPKEIPARVEVIPSGPVIELPGPKEEFTEEEIQQAIAAEDEKKIKPGIKKIDLMLKEISKKRKFFEDIERETFLLRLFTKKGMPRSNLLSEKFLDTLQDYLDKLDRSFDLYLRLAKKEGKGKYAEAISAFKEAYKKERLNFVEVQKYKAVRKEVKGFINYLNRRYPAIGEIVSRRLKKPTDLSSEIRNFIDHDDSLNDNERELLHTNVDKIDNAITTYSKVLSDFFNELANCKRHAEAILALRP